MITHRELIQSLEYDADTGVFTRKLRQAQMSVGSVCGTEKSKGGYIQIRIGRKSYLAHRLAWLYVTGSWPKGDLDHKNMDRSDNRFANLREASRSLNMRNVKAFANNKTGLKGTSWRPDKRKWRAAISIGGKQTHLGYFDCAEDAHGAYVAAVTQHFGEFARSA